MEISGTEYLNVLKGGAFSSPKIEKGYWVYLILKNWHLVGIRQYEHDITLGGWLQFVFAPPTKK